MRPSLLVHPLPPPLGALCRWATRLAGRGTTPTQTGRSRRPYAIGPTWLGLGPTRRGSNPTPTFARLSASAFTRRPSFSRSCIRPADADMRQVLQCCRKNGRGNGWLGQEQDALARLVPSTRAGDFIDSVQHASSTVLYSTSTPHRSSLRCTAITASVTFEVRVCRVCLDVCVAFVSSK